MIYLALLVGTFAALIALVALVDLGARMFTDARVVGHGWLPAWMVFTSCSLIAVSATLAVWLFTIALPVVLK